MMSKSWKHWPQTCWNRNSRVPGQEIFIPLSLLLHDKSYRLKYRLSDITCFLLISAFHGPYWLSSSIFPCLFVVCCPAMVTPDKISDLFNIYRHKSPILTQYHHISTSTTLYWPSTTKCQPVPPQYHQVPTSNTFYWTSTIIYHIQMSYFPLSTWDEHSCTLV